MAKKQIIDSIVKLYSKLGGNISDVLGTRSNVNFMGTGKSSEPFLDMDLNIEALGAISKSKALEELKSSVGFATAEKLNDIQANKLLTNMMKMDEFYNPPAAPANITDLATGTRNLDQEGLGSLRAGNRQMTDDEIRNFADEFGINPTEDYYNFDGTLASAQKILKDSQDETAYMYQQYKAGKLDPAPVEANREKFLRGKFDEMEASGDKRLMNRDEIEELSAFDDLPPPGSRGGADDIAAPVEQGFEGFERTIRELAKSDPELAAQYRTVLTNKGGNPAKRGAAREFLLEALKKDEYDVGTAAFGKTNLNNIISAEDVKYITEGGGGIGGDPLLLVEKYFGPRIRDLVPEGASSEEIIIFTKRVLENVEDAAGLKPDNPKFDRMTAMFVDEMADGGRAGFFAGGLGRLGKAGYQAIRKYGIEAEDITDLFKNLATDKSLVGKEKTEYFKMLNQVLKNPDDYPDGVREILMRLGKPIDFKSGGLAKILEV